MRAVSPSLPRFFFLLPYPLSSLRISLSLSLTVHPSIGLFDRDVVLKTLHWLGRDLRVEIRHCHYRRRSNGVSFPVVTSSCARTVHKITPGNRASSARQPPFSIRTVRALVEQCRHPPPLSQSCRSIASNAEKGRGTHAQKDNC